MGWNNIRNMNELNFKEWSISDKYAGLTSLHSEDLGAMELGFHVEILLSEKYSCPYHFHHAEEELFLILEGEATLRQNNEFRVVKEGDLIFFKTGQEFAHQFYNHTDRDCRLLILSSKNKFDVCEYPDSDKILVRNVKKLFLRSQEVPYMNGEENPEDSWPMNSKN